MRWHSLFRASLGFCGYDLAKNVGAPRAVSVCVALPSLPTVPAPGSDYLPFPLPAAWRRSS